MPRRLPSLLLVKCLFTGALLLLIAAVGGRRGGVAYALPQMSDAKDQMLADFGSLHCFFSLRGFPKSGTTWTEVIVKALIDYHCQVDGGECQQVHMKSDRDVNRKNVAGNSKCAAQLLFSETQKHSLPSSKKLQEEAFGAWVNVACDDIRSREGMDQCLESTGLDEVFEELAAPAESFERTDNDQHVETRFRDGTRYIVIFRDPRAVLVSRCHYLNKDLATCASKVRFIRFARLLLFVYKFWMRVQAVSDQILLLHYEDLSNDFHSQLQSLNSFLGFRELASAEIDLLKAATSSKTMGAMGKAGILPGSKANEVPGVDGAKVFRATTTGWMEDVPPSEQEFMNHTIEYLFPDDLRQKYGLATGAVVRDDIATFINESQRETLDNFAGKAEQRHKQFVQGLPTHKYDGPGSFMGHGDSDESGSFASARSSNSHRGHNGRLQPPHLRGNPPPQKIGQSHRFSPNVPHSHAPHSLTDTQMAQLQQDRAARLREILAQRKSQQRSRGKQS